MNFFGTNQYTGGKNPSLERTTTVIGGHDSAFRNTQSKSHEDYIFSPRNMLYSESLRTPNGSSLGTPNTPNRDIFSPPYTDGMGTPNADPINDNIMLPTTNASGQTDRRGVVDNAEDSASPGLSLFLSTPTEHLLVQPPSLTQRTVPLNCHRNVAHETLTAYLHSPSGGSPSPLPEPGYHLLVASPLSLFSAGSPTRRRRTSWRSPRSQLGPRSPYEVQPATPGSPLVMTPGRYQSPRQHPFAVPARSQRPPGSAGASLLSFTRPDPFADLPDPAPEPTADPTTLPANPSAGPAEQAAHPVDQADQAADPADQAADPADQVADPTDQAAHPDGDLARNPSDSEDAEDAADDDDDVSVTSPDGDTSLDEMDVPQAYCRPLAEEANLLCSNRHVAHPHLASPVLGDSRQHTRFGRVRFTVFPAIRWARDPKEKRRLLARARAALRKLEREKKKTAGKRPRDRISPDRTKLCTARQASPVRSAPADLAICEGKSTLRFQEFPVIYSGQ